MLVLNHMSFNVLFSELDFSVVTWLRGLQLSQVSVQVHLHFAAYKSLVVFGSCYSKLHM